jgi:HEAT repeat protein
MTASPSAPGEPPAPVPAAVPVPPPPKVRRWPTAVITFLLTAVAALAIGWYLVRNVLPARAWWVREVYKGNGADERAQGAYLEAVLFSRLSDADKLNLLFEAIGSSDALRANLSRVERKSSSIETDPVSEVWFGFGDAARVISPSVRQARGEYTPGDRYPYLRKPLTEVVTRVLTDPHAATGTQRHALYFLNVLVELARYPELVPKSSAGIDLRFDCELARRDLAALTPHLVRFLSSGDLVQKRLAVRAFAGIGMPLWAANGGPRPDDAVQVFPTVELVACLSDNDEFVRARAVEALAFTPNSDCRQALPALIARFTAESNRDIRTAVVRTLGLLGPTAEHDPRPPLVAFLNTPRVPFPVAPDGGDIDRWQKDGFFRAEVLLALLRMPATPDAVAAARVTFAGMKPQKRQTDSAGLAAALYLGRNGRDGPTLLAALRWQWAEHTKTGRLEVADQGLDDLALFTLAAAVLADQTTARSAYDDLIRMMSACKHESLRHRVRPYTHRRYTAYPRAAESWWPGMFPNVPYDWLPEELEKLGPPDPDDVPAVYALLGDENEPVRREAAKALVRHALRGAPRDVPVLGALALHPFVHPEVSRAAREALGARGVYGFHP